MKLLREPAYDSRPVGDVVLAVPPPYRMLPWLGMGIPLISALIEQAGIRSRIVRFLDDPYETPEEISEAAETLMWTAPSLEERLASIRSMADRNRDFFDRLLARLLGGPERLFGLSTWRLNSDLVLELARLLKKRRPEAIVVIGGPEATVNTTDFQRDWIDVIITGAAEGVVAPVMRALLDDTPEKAAVWENVWLNPRLEAPSDLPRKHPEAVVVPRIDYTKIVPLLLTDPDPVFPVIMNIGCPFRCSFCTNTSIYPELEWGTPRRLFDEMTEISRLWAESFEGQAPPMRLGMCDATVNAQPAQFDELCELIAKSNWPARPTSIEGHIVLDTRTTSRRVELAAAAGFQSLFFGLETASRRLRRAMKKPGSLDAVAQALRCFDEVGKGATRIVCGVIVGWPDETEEEFYESVSFLNWVACLDVVKGLAVNPLFRTPAAMDRELFKGADGSPYGLHWRMPTPGGSPAVRARRFLYMVDHFAGILPVIDTIPLKYVREMLDNPSEAFWNRWEQARLAAPPEPEAILPSGQEELASAKGQRLGALSFEATQNNLILAQIRDSLTPRANKTFAGGWTLQAVEPWIEDPSEAATLEFVSVPDNCRVAILVERRSEEREAYARTMRFNLSYLSELDGNPCQFDHDVMAALIAAISDRDPRVATGPTG